MLCPFVFDHLLTTAVWQSQAALRNLLTTAVWQSQAALRNLLTTAVWQSQAALGYLNSRRCRLLWQQDPPL